MGSSISIEQQEFLHILGKWWITVAVMGSLLMQLLLLFTGGTRKWNMACRFLAWNAYNWSDFVATSALGGLAQGAAGNANKKEVYAIWAPILLLHLGAPDNISAYAMADAELWQRHGLTMLLQVAMVVYVVANCARGWKYVLLSICLTAVGSIKYAERTFALKHASRADVVQSALPIYKYMVAEARLNLDIKGLNIPALSSQSLLPVSHTPHPNPSYYYIIQGEKQWFQKFLHAGNTNYIHSFRDAALSTPELVTLQDILCSQQLRQTAPSMVLLCAGFALFKLYKRRLSNLNMYEWREEKTRQLFVPKHVFEDVKEIMFVLDVELRFLFDSLYTKAAGTAFSKLGVSFRMLATILLVVSGVLIFGDLNLQDQALEQARNVTFCLIAAALVIEAYQLARLALSDWSRVWLVCTFIIVGEELKNQSNSSISYFLKSLWQATLLGMIKFYSHIGRHKYWRSSIGQFTIVDVNNRSRCIHVKPAKLLRRDHLQLLPKYVHNKQVVEEFKSYVFTKALEACRGAPMEHRTLPPDWFMHKYNDAYLQRRIVRAAFGMDDQVGNRVYIDLEHLMVNWHVATCMCELLATQPCPMQRADVGVPDHHEHANIHISNETSRHAGSPAASPGQQELAAGRENTTDVDLRMSKLLSRYMMYLLVHKTELLPCHADIARQLAADTQRDMCAITWNTEFITRAHMTPNMPEVPFNLRRGMKAGSLLQGLPSDHVRWRLVADVWVDILVCAASSNKPIEQLHQLTVGGEFLTHLWVLLGHMGYGAQ